MRGVWAKYVFGEYCQACAKYARAHKVNWGSLKRWMELTAPKGSASSAMGRDSGGFELQAGTQKRDKAQQWVPGRADQEDGMRGSGKTSAKAKAESCQLQSLQGWKQGLAFNSYARHHWIGLNNFFFLPPEKTSERVLYSAWQQMSWGSSFKGKSIPLDLPLILLEKSPRGHPVHSALQKHGRLSGGVKTSSHE